MLWRAEEAADIRYSMSVMVFIFLTVMALMARSFNANYADILRLRFENLDLAESLRRRNELVEQANLDKSPFLAAASHDLRQPIHALGLFLGALRASSLPTKGVACVDQIEASAAAMDGLFSSLLDISRLDAGIVEVRRKSFAIRPLLDRICGDQAEEAEAKSLSSSSIPLGGRAHRSRADRAHPAQPRRQRDPLYRSRPHRRRLPSSRRSDRAQIWDTAADIPTRSAREVFQEYYQMDNPERDRAKGLRTRPGDRAATDQLLGCRLSSARRPAADPASGGVADSAAARPMLPPPERKSCPARWRRA